MPRQSLLLVLIGLASLTGCRTAAPRPSRPEAEVRTPTPTVTAEPLPTPRPTPSDPSPRVQSPPRAITAPLSFVPGVGMKELRPGLWLHTSRGENGGPTSNGLLIMEHQRLVLVNAPASAAATAELLGWAERELQQSVSRVVFTHAEESALAGARLLDERHIPLVALASTAARLGVLGGPRVSSLGELAPGASVRLGTIELYYPGLDHRRDAALVWLREARLLYGGCAVKSLDSAPLPFLSSSERQSWSAGIRRVLQRFPDATVVVTMEGGPGGPDLLQHTLRLLAAAAP